MRITDIAEAAGYSSTTVSRVIHEKGYVSPRTALKIKEIIQQLGYHPKHRKHTAEQPALMGDTILLLSIGEVLLTDYTCCTNNLRNLSLTLKRHGFRMLYSHLPDEQSTLPRLLKFVAGVIVLKGTLPESLLRMLDNRPLVSLFSSCDHGDQLVSGHYNVGQMAARYLIERRPQQILILNALPELADTAEQIQGFMLFCQRRGLSACEISSSNSLKPPPGEELDILQRRIELLCESLLKFQEERIGVFIPGDWMTAVLYRCLRKRGIDPTRRFVMISSGCVPGALAGLYPRPATIDIGLNTLAEQAINILMLRMQTHAPVQRLQIALQPTLIPGEEG